MEKALRSSKVKLFVGLKKYFVVTVLVVAALSLTGTNISATEGVGCYPNGAEDFMSGAVPPPGTYFINYLFYITADEFKDGDGKSTIPDFDLKATANVFRFLHVTNKKVFGGFWGVHVFVPLVYVDYELFGMSDTNSGLGDIIVDPFILSWHFKNFHFATGIDIYIPTGQYNEKDPINVGTNYWTFEPIFAFTFLSDDGFEVSSKFMYDINTENTDTDYQSGQEFHFDYTVGKKFGPLSVGIGGYYYKQVTNDEFKGVKVGTDGFKGQAFAFGPQVKYDYKNMSFILKYHHEIEVENRPELDKFWFKFVYAF